MRQARRLARGDGIVAGKVRRPCGRGGCGRGGHGDEDILKALGADDGVDEVLRGAFGEDVAAIDDDEAVAQALGLFHEVGDE